MVGKAVGRWCNLSIYYAVHCAVHCTELHRILHNAMYTHCVVLYSTLHLNVLCAVLYTLLYSTESCSVMHTAVMCPAVEQCSGAVQCNAVQYLLVH